MKASFFSTLLAVSGAPMLASAGVLPRADAPAIPLNDFPPNKFVTPITIDEAKGKTFYKNETEERLQQSESFVTIQATCANPRIRMEWDNASASQRNAYLTGIRCLMGRSPSGRFSQSRNRYEDFVALHQNLTPNVHGNAKFLLWHRYYLWAFEDVLRTECGYSGGLLWFDESRYSGRFSQSSIFSSQYYGGIALGGRCVTDGRFSGITLNVGPGTSNRAHCLSRNGDASKTANTNSGMVSACNSRSSYADMAACQEGGVHAWGHNGIGAVMSDVYASPADPVFFLHHGFVDRNFRIWQNANPSRVSTVNGNDVNGRPLTLDMMVDLAGIRNAVRIRDILNTMDTTLCYRYNY